MVERVHAKQTEFDEEMAPIVGSGRCEPQVSFLHPLLSELGHGQATGLSPVVLFSAALQIRPLIIDAQDMLKVLATPAQP